MSVQESAVVRQRSAIVVTPDVDLGKRLFSCLASMRWTVLTAGGGAEAMAHLAAEAPEAMIVDHWLPDLDLPEFLEYAAALCPHTDVLHMDGSPASAGARSTRRHELLHAIREAQEQGESIPIGAGAPQATGSQVADRSHTYPRPPVQEVPSTPVVVGRPAIRQGSAAPVESSALGSLVHSPSAAVECYPAEAMDIKAHLPDMIGDAHAMVDLSRLVRLVAPHAVTVLIQGETGTGKELVAKAVHRLSTRAARAFVVLNCAAIPEHLLEAELFGHTRGAFTGAVSSRVGRIEAAHGGTLFLDEIGEMPLALQAKMLRFLESGEIQRVGDNDVSHVDVRIVAATHQPLEANIEDRRFRLDLYHRLAVFPVEVPALRDRREDIPMLVEHFLRKFAENAPRKSITRDALVVLHEQRWEGNVRELYHVVQRAVIMAGDAPVIAPEHLRIRSTPRPY
ncbi:MAG: sigma-54 dependent transcriptional regulator [Janthinobacterium lividum]